MSDPRELLDAYAAGLPPIHGAAEFGEIVADTVPELVAALRAVLDLHKPETIVVWPDPDAPTGAVDEWTICPYCSAERDYAPWPCPTVQAITTALEDR